MPLNNGSSISAKVRKEFLTGEKADLPPPKTPPYGVGRPPFTLEKLQNKFPKWREMMIEAAVNGSGQSQMVDDFDIDPAAFECLLRDSLEFRTHYKKCLNKQKMALEKRALKNLENRNFNHNLWQMFMVNWFDYKTANSKNEIQGDLNVEKTEKVKLENLTLDEIQNEIQKRLGVKDGEIES